MVEQNIPNQRYLNFWDWIEKEKREAAHDGTGFQRQDSRDRMKSTFPQQVAVGLKSIDGEHEGLVRTAEETGNLYRKCPALSHQLRRCILESGCDFKDFPPTRSVWRGISDSVLAVVLLHRNYMYAHKRQTYFTVYIIEFVLKNTKIFFCM